MFILYKIVVIMGAWLYFNQSWKYLELAGESRVLPPGKKKGIYNCIFTPTNLLDYLKKTPAAQIS